MFRGKAFVGCQVIRNCRCGFTEHIRHNGIQCHIANSKRILKAVFLATFHRNQLIPVTSKLTQNADIQVWNETIFHKTNAK